MWDWRKCLIAGHARAGCVLQHTDGRANQQRVGGRAPGAAAGHPKRHQHQRHHHHECVRLPFTLPLWSVLLSVTLSLARSQQPQSITVQEARRTKSPAPRAPSSSSPCQEAVVVMHGTDLLMPGINKHCCVASHMGIIVQACVHPSTGNDTFSAS